MWDQNKSKYTRSVLNRHVCDDFDGVPIDFINDYPSPISNKERDESDWPLTQYDEIDTESGYQLSVLEELDIERAIELHWRTHHDPASVPIAETRELLHSQHQTAKGEALQALTQQAQLQSERRDLAVQSIAVWAVDKYEDPTAISFLLRSSSLETVQWDDDDWMLEHLLSIYTQIPDPADEWAVKDVLGRLLLSADDKTDHSKQIIEIMKTKNKKISEIFHQEVNAKRLLGQLISEIRPYSPFEENILTNQPVKVVNIIQRIIIPFTDDKNINEIRLDTTGHRLNERKYPPTEQELILLTWWLSHPENEIVDLEKFDLLFGNILNNIENNFVHSQEYLEFSKNDLKHILVLLYLKRGNVQKAAGVLETESDNSHLQNIPSVVSLNLPTSMERRLVYLYIASASSPEDILWYIQKIENYQVPRFIRFIEKEVGATLAAKAYLRAQKCMFPAPERGWEYETYLKLSELFADTKEIEAAVAVYEDAANYIESTNKLYNKPHKLCAAELVKLGKFTKALRMLGKGKHHRKHANPGGAIGMGKKSIYHTFGEILRQECSTKQFENAISAIERYSWDKVHQGHIMPNHRDKYMLYQEYIDYAVQQGKYNQAIKMSERGVENSVWRYSWDGKCPVKSCDLSISIEDISKHLRESHAPRQEKK